MNTTDPHEVMRAMRDANYHHPGLRCLRLLRLEADFFAALQEDVRRLCAEQQPSDVTAPGHVTHWTRPSGQVVQYSLLNASGRFDDFSSDHNLSVFGKRFYAAERYPALAAFVAAFPQAVNFRVNILGPMARLAPHEEHNVVRLQSGAVGLRPRFHLPVFTHPGAEINLDEDVFFLEAGSVYFINHGCFHAARNKNPAARTHLVWDLLLTREAFSLLFDPAAALPFPAERVAPAAQTPRPLRQERLGAVQRIPAPVDEEDAGEIMFCELQ